MTVEICTNGIMDFTPLRIGIKFHALHNGSTLEMPYHLPKGWMEEIEEKEKQEGGQSCDISLWSWIESRTAFQNM